MLPGIENDLLYLLNILEALGKISLYASGFNDAEKFYEADDQLHFNAVLNQFSYIGENTAKLSKEIKQKYNNVNWQSVKDFRNRIVHNYAGLDIFVVFEIITSEIPATIKFVEDIVRKEVLSGIFSSEEYELAKNSKYYRHINF